MPQPEHLIADAEERESLHLREQDAAFVESLWTRYRLFAENGSVARFKNPASTQAMFWEMYLTCVLLQEGHEVVCLPEPDGGRCGPDMLVQDGNRRIWFEAHAPELGDGPDGVPIHPPDGQCRNVPDREMTLRFTSSIRAKTAAFRRYLGDNRSGVRPDDAMIIATSGGKMPLRYLEADPPRVVKAVLPFGNAMAIYDRARAQPVGWSHEYRPEIARVGGPAVPTAFFDDRDNSCISAIVFSYMTPWPVEVPPVLGHDLIVIHNPNAIVPIRRGFISVGQEYHVEEGHLLRQTMPKSRQ